MDSKDYDKLDMYALLRMGNRMIPRDMIWELVDSYVDLMNKLLLKGDEPIKKKPLRA